jgi:hypothetical protein
MSHLVPLLEFNHYWAAKADSLAWTAEKLKEFGFAQKGGVSALISSRRFARPLLGHPINPTPEPLGQR